MPEEQRETDEEQESEPGSRRTRPSGADTFRRMVPIVESYRGRDSYTEQAFTTDQTGPE